MLSVRDADEYTKLNNGQLLGLVFLWRTMCKKASPWSFGLADVSPS
jgi:hypothetical protein